MKKTVYLVIGLVLLFSAGCGEDKGLIADLKKMQLMDRESETVGQALDNYKYFTTTDWTLTGEDTVTPVVIFHGKFDIDALLVDGCDKIQQQINQPKVQKYLSEVHYKVDFVLAQHNATVEIANSRFETVCADGVSRKYPDYQYKLIEAIYTDKHIAGDCAGLMEIVDLCRTGN